MMRLNLLPWRERQRQAALRRFRGQLVGGALLALCAVMLVDQLARQRGHQQVLANTQRQATLDAQDEQLQSLADVRAQHEALLARAVALEGLRAIRVYWPVSSPTLKGRCLKVCSYLT